MDVSTLINTLQNLTKCRITKAEIARALSVDPAALRRKELAKVQLKQSEFEKIEKHFNVKILQNYNNGVLRENPHNYILKCWGQNIQKLRAENDLSIDKFCKITGIQQQKLIEYINDNKTPDVEDLIKIKNHFNISIDDLLFNNNNKDDCQGCN